MSLTEWFGRWHLSSVRLKAPGVGELEFDPKEPDRDAAWDLYVELITRITTQPLGSDVGVEKAALDSVYSLFPLTREIIKRHGRGCAEFTKVAVVVLNQIVRPFTAKWHQKATAGAFADPSHCQSFRSELAVLQGQLRQYTKSLADLAGVEDLTELSAA